MPRLSVLTSSALCILVGVPLEPAATARGDTVELADGRVLEGRFAILAGVAIDPATAEFRGETGGPILMCDDELTRTMSRSAAS